MADAKRRKLDLVVCWKLDRFGRSLAHLKNAIQTLTDAGVGLTSLGEGIDTRSAAGWLMLGILGSFAEFERERIRERIHAGIARAKREGKRLGRRPHHVTDDDLMRTTNLSQHEAANMIGVPRSVLQRARAARNGVSRKATFAPDSLPAQVAITPVP
jgi:putative DNA-invertase from lambdoid prophage Rac